jgi:sorbitol-specific phosphotransferase system component IIA
LGSLNGTHVNGVKHGGRAWHESPESAENRHPEVDVTNGDTIRVGRTVFLLSVMGSVVCKRCGKEIPDSVKSLCDLGNGTHACSDCIDECRKEFEVTKVQEYIVCKLCGKVAPPEIDPMGGNEYLCESCRESEASGPASAVTLVFDGAREHIDIPGYEVGRLIGVGGMGAVYLGRRLSDGLQVAIKVLLSKMAVQEKLRNDFRREIDVTMKLRHPNVVRLYDHGSSGPGFYFVMEYCAGGSVDSLLEARGGILTFDEAVPIMLQTLEGLAFAHKQGFVHRDLKPGNIFLTAEVRGVAKIADMGVAKNFQMAGFSGMTVTGSKSGTPVFMPKEQLLNFKYVLPVSDIWSIAATFYKMLTGEFTRDVLEGESPLDVVLKRDATPIRERNPDIPVKPAAVLDRALSEKTEARYQNGGEFLKALKKAI